MRELEMDNEMNVDTEKTNHINRLKMITHSCILILWLIILVVFHKKLILVKHKEYELIGLIISLLIIIWNMFSQQNVN